MVTLGWAQSEAERLGGPVHVVDMDGRPRWHPVWEGQDGVARPSDVAAGYVMSCSGSRPYIRRWDTQDGSPLCVYSGWRASDHRARLRPGPAAAAIGAAARARLGPFVVIEPNVCAKANRNKRWPWSRWQALVRMMPTVRFAQVGPAGTRTLDGAAHVETPTYVEACGVLAHTDAYVGWEGGLHHAAAALGVPAVVLFPGFSSVEATGYEDHRNVAGPGPACGRWAPCDHCEFWAASVRPIDLAMNLAGVLGERLEEPPLVLANPGGGA